MIYWNCRARLDGVGKGVRVEGSKVELAENSLILSQIYTTLLYSTPSPSSSIETDQQFICF